MNRKHFALPLMAIAAIIAPSATRIEAGERCARCNAAPKTCVDCRDRGLLSLINDMAINLQNTAKAKISCDSGCDSCYSSCDAGCRHPHPRERDHNQPHQHAHRHRGQACQHQTPTPPTADPRKPQAGQADGRARRLPQYPGPDHDPLVNPRPEIEPPSIPARRWVPRGVTPVPQRGRTPATELQRRESPKPDSQVDPFRDDSDARPNVDDVRGNDSVTDGRATPPRFNRYTTDPQAFNHYRMRLSDSNGEDRPTVVEPAAGSSPAQRIASNIESDDPAPVISASSTAPRRVSSSATPKLPTRHIAPTTNPLR